MSDVTVRPEHHPVLRAAFVSGLDARDHALFLRCALLDSSPRAARLFWTSLTHLGGATGAIIAAILPTLCSWTSALQASRMATTALVVSHLIVQVVKRTVARPRPSHRLQCAPLTAEPDRFSLPSGHAAAAMSVAFVYAMAFPAWSAPLLLLAGLVGMSRVFLGVHYPGDVLMGQLIAIATCLVL